LSQNFLLTKKISIFKNFNFRTEDISDNVDEAGGLVLTTRRSSVTNMTRHGSIPGEVTATMYPISEFGFVDGHSGASTPGQGPVHGPRDRFKVVKIETSAPQRRGRWTCIEYADKNTSTASNSGATSTAVASATTTGSTATTTTTTAAQSDVLTTTATSTLSSVEPIVSSSEYDSIPIQQQQQQQQQQLLSPTAPTAKVPLSLVEEIESLLPVKPLNLILPMRSISYFVAWLAKFIHQVLDLPWYLFSQFSLPLFLSFSKAQTTPMLQTCRVFS
jgi:hypothetical protein